MKFYLGEIKLPVKKCIKPKMTLHRGRTWDYGWNVFINGEMIKMWFDSSWGFNMFFEYCLQWYKVPMGSGLFNSPQYDIDITDNTKKYYIKTL